MEEKTGPLLIVDDHEPTRRILRELLQSAFPGCELLVAADGATALALCVAHQPRAVLVDVGLPDANGIELASRIKSLLPRVAVLIVSSHATSAHRAHARAAGAAAYVDKERLREELLPALDAALRGRRA